MKQRLQKLISSAGIASRRKAEELILQGKVVVNGRQAALGESADPDADVICVDGKRISIDSGRVYLMLNKPRGYVTTLSDEKGRASAAELVAGCGVRVYPVGRLDMDSEGLLVFTNDGEFANHLMHPGGVVEKCYEVWVSGFTMDGYKRLTEPMEMDGRILCAPVLSELAFRGDRAYFRITIHEGRNRQIRRMCEACSMQVHRLRRIREGSILLGDLAPGKWRYLTPQEIDKI